LPALYTSRSRPPAIVIARGSSAERALISRLIISRFAGSEIICENPLVIRIGRGYDIASVRDYIKGLGGGFDIAVEEDREDSWLGCPEHRGEKPGPHTGKSWIPFPLSFKGVVVEKGEAIARCIALNPIARIASTAVPSLISTMGRFINDVNMMLIGAAISGGVFAVQSLGLRKASKKR